MFSKHRKPVHTLSQCITVKSWGSFAWWALRGIKSKLSVSSRNIPIKPKPFTICTATLNYEDLKTSIQYSLTKKIAIFKEGLTLITYLNPEMLYIQLYSNYITYCWPSIILDYAVSEDGCHRIWQLLFNVYDYLGLKTHRSDSSSERTEGVEAMGTARWLEVSPQDSGQKKMGEEGRRGRIRK